MQAWCMRVVGVLLASADIVAARSLRRQPNSVAPPLSQPNEFSQPRRALGYVMDDSNIRDAVDAWLSNSASAEATYGHISTWETSGVTDMSYLFCAHPLRSYCKGHQSFNDDISAWDTSAVTTMQQMFYWVALFNQPLGNWRIDSVTDIGAMFHSALAFDQDLGWCLDYDVNTYVSFVGGAFEETQCASTSCGISWGGANTCAPTRIPTPIPTPSPTPAPTTAAPTTAAPTRARVNDDDDSPTMTSKDIMMILASVVGLVLYCACCRCYLRLKSETMEDEAREQYEKGAVAAGVIAAPAPAPAAAPPSPALPLGTGVWSWQKLRFSIVKGRGPWSPTEATLDEVRKAAKTIWAAQAHEETNGESWAQDRATPLAPTDAVLVRELEAGMGGTLSDRLNPGHPAFDAALKARWKGLGKKTRQQIVAADTKRNRDVRPPRPESDPRPTLDEIRKAMTTLETEWRSACHVYNRVMVESMLRYAQTALRAREEADARSRGEDRVVETPPPAPAPIETARAHEETTGESCAQDSAGTSRLAYGDSYARGIYFGQRVELRPRGGQRQEGIFDVSGFQVFDLACAHGRFVSVDMESGHWVVQLDNKHSIWDSSGNVLDRESDEPIKVPPQDIVALSGAALRFEAWFPCTYNWVCWLRFRITEEKTCFRRCVNLSLLILLCPFALCGDLILLSVQVPLPVIYFFASCFHACCCVWYLVDRGPPGGSDSGSGGGDWSTYSHGVDFRFT